MFRVATIALLALALALPGSVRAHSGLARSSPPAGSTVSPAPKEVVLSFSEKLESNFSTIEVRNAKGAAVHEGSTSVEHTQMRVVLKALPPGTYKVIWRVLSVDTHRSQGTFTFRVGP